MTKLNKIIHLGILRTVPRFLFNCLNHVLWPGHTSYLNSSAIASVFQKGLFVNRGQLSIGFCVTAFFLGRLMVSERSISGSSSRTRQKRMPAAFHGCCLQGTFGHYPHRQSVMDTHGTWCKEDQHWRGAMNVTRNSTSPLPSGFSTQ